MSVVLGLLAERVGQPRVPPHPHPHRQVLRLDVASRDVRRVRVASDDLDFGLGALGRAVLPLGRAGIAATVDLDQLTSLFGSERSVELRGAGTCTGHCSTCPTISLLNGLPGANIPLGGLGDGPAPPASAGLGSRGLSRPGVLRTPGSCALLPERRGDCTRPTGASGEAAKGAMGHAGADRRMCGGSDSRRTGS